MFQCSVGTVRVPTYQNKAGLRIRSKIPEPARKVNLYTYVYNYRYVFGLGEELHEAAVREVFEETGISTKFKSIVAFRQAAQFSARPPPPSAKKSRIRPCSELVLCTPLLAVIEIVSFI